MLKNQNQGFLGGQGGRGREQEGVLGKERVGQGSQSNTVKTLNIGTPRLTTVVFLNIKQFNFTMQ